MPDADVSFLSAEQARYLVETAENSRTYLGGFAEHPVGYDATALQLLDEWIERVLKEEPDPPQQMRVLWIAFLGETFRRRFEGEWVVHEADGQTLAVLCPSVQGGLHVVEVATQVHLRIVNGFADSLALFYLQESIRLRQRREVA
jgi:hypothetical protein